MQLSLPVNNCFPSSPAKAAALTARPASSSCLPRADATNKLSRMMMPSNVYRREEVSSRAASFAAARSDLPSSFCGAFPSPGPVAITVCHCHGVQGLGEARQGRDFRQRERRR